MPLTKKQQKEYIGSNHKCPYCHSTNISGWRIETDDGEAYQPITCNECEKSWNDLYTLTGIEEIE